MWFLLREITQELLYCAVTRHWKALPWESVESLSLEIIKNCLASTLCHVLWDDPSWRGCWNGLTPCGPLQPDPLCDSVKYMVLLRFISHIQERLLFKTLLVLLTFESWGKIHKKSIVLTVMFKHCIVSNWKVASTSERFDNCIVSF